MQVDPRRLLVLRAVRRAGGVLPAARALFLTPSAVSQHLSRLEEETGLALVDRSRRGGGRALTLTAAGQALADHGDRMAEVLAEAEADLGALRGERAGPVRIAGFSTALRRLVAPAIVDLSISEPGIVPTVTEVDEPIGLAQLRAGELDLVVLERLPGAPTPRGLVVEDLLRDPYRVVVPAGWRQPDEADAILRGPWITGHEDVPARGALLRLAARDGVRPDIRHVLDEFTSMLTLVGAGLGASIVTDLVLEALPHPGVRPVAGALDPGERLLAVAHRRGRAEPSPAATVMLEALRNHSAVRTA